MAAPPNKTLQPLSGNWHLNKSCSGDFNLVLALQDVNIIICKATTAASVHLKFTQTDGQHIRMAQFVTGGKIPGTTEDYTLDWTWRTKDDMLFWSIAVVVVGSVWRREKIQR
jgi:hypothetical protein